MSESSLRSYYKKHKYYRDKAKENHIKNRERDNTRMRAYRAKYIAQDPDWEKRYSDRKKQNLLQQLYAQYGKGCACCGELEEKFLTIDHIKNDGGEHRKKYGPTKMGLMYLMRREGWPKDRYQILCMNCNWGRQNNGGTCPHIKNVVELCLGKNKVFQTEDA